MNEMKTNLRHVRLDHLIKIRDNDYKSPYHSDNVYCKETVDKEISRKLDNRKCRDIE